MELIGTKKKVLQLKNGVSGNGFLGLSKYYIYGGSMFFLSYSLDK